jgi:DNA-binding transcriptional regulator YdaS (Cro superfamily)
MLKVDVIRHFKSAAAAAKAFGVSQSAVSQWGVIVPERIAWKAQILTGGVLRVDPSLYVRKASRSA